MNKRLSALIALAFTLAGCATDSPTHYYEISTLPAPTRETHFDAELFVAEIRVPDAFSRSEMVIQRVAPEYDVIDGQRWLSPMDEQIRRAVVSDLQADLPNLWITRVRSSSATAKCYTLRIEVQSITLSIGGDAQIVAAWTLEDESKQILRRERGTFDSKVAGNGYASIAIATSTAIARLAGQMAEGFLPGK